MSVRDQGAGLACGLVLGALLGWASAPVVPWSPLTAAARAMPAGEPHEALRPPPAAPRVPPGADADAVAVIEAQDQQIRALYDLAFGRPLVWPDDESRLAVEDAFHEAISTCAPEATLLELDCSEPPCLAVFALDSGDEVSDLCPGVPRNGYMGAGNRLCADGRPRPQLQVVQVGSESLYRDGNEHEDLDFGPNAFVRFRTRSKELMSAAADVLCP